MDVAALLIVRHPTIVPGRPGALAELAWWTTMTADARTQGSEAMARYAAGDDAAFVELYEALSPRLFGFLFRLTRERSAAEDLLQQTFLQIHDARGRFTQGADVTPWAMAIGRRLFIDMTRRHASRDTHSVDGEVLDRTTIDPTPSAEDWLVARETEATVQAGLATLGPSQREAFRLIKEEGLSIAEAAAVIGTTTSAIKLRVHRAYLRVRETLLAAEKTR